MNSVPDTHFRIGVVGYINCFFDRDLAAQLVESAVTEAARKLLLQAGKLKPVIVVGGITDIGITGIVHQYALRQGHPYAGISCSLAKDCRRLQGIDIELYHGHKWGEEYELMLQNVDALVRIGGEQRAHSLIQTAKDLGILTVERSLKTMPRTKASEKKKETGSQAGRSATNKNPR